MKNRDNFKLTISFLFNGFILKMAIAKKAQGFFLLFCRTKIHRKPSKTRSGKKSHIFPLVRSIFCNQHENWQFILDWTDFDVFSFHFIRKYSLAQPGQKDFFSKFQNTPLNRFHWSFSMPP